MPSLSKNMSYFDFSKSTIYALADLTWPEKPIQIFERVSGFTTDMKPETFC